MSTMKTARKSTAPEIIGAIRTNYRLAKAAEDSRIRIDHGLSAFARAYLTSWRPDGEELSRKSVLAQVSRVIEAVRKGEDPKEGDDDLYDQMAAMVLRIDPVRDEFEQRRKEHRKLAEKAVQDLPAWRNIAHVRGFSSWGLAALIGEAGDIGQFSGRRKLYKFLGLAPDECYPTGEKKSGRKIPRSKRGRIMGIIADPLLRAQWRGEKEDGSHVLVESRHAQDPVIIPAHAIGPYGQVYGDTKARKLEEGFTKGHADKYARRAMVKALIGDVWAAWHEEELRFPVMLEAAD